IEDLRRARDAIREEIRRRIIEANPLAVQLDDEEAPPSKPAGGDPATDWLDPKKPLPREQIQQRFARYVDGLYVHPDHRSLTAVAVTFGLTRLVIGYLNTQTAFLGAIVLGNGINYGLIYLARVKQLRRRGIELVPACVEGAQSTAEATLLASAATSVSFGTLIIAANRGFRHFGIIGGMGMLLCWMGTFLLVPALLAVYEKARGAPKATPEAA